LRLGPAQAAHAGRVRLVRHTLQAEVTRRRRAPFCALVLVLILTVVAGCGSGGNAGVGRGPLRWAKTPFVGGPALLQTDRVGRGEIHNDSKQTLELDARKVRVRAAAGHWLVSSARFVAGYTHPP